MVLVTIEEVQARIIELEEIKAKPKLEYRYATSDEYIDDLIDTNLRVLRVLQRERH